MGPKYEPVELTADDFQDSRKEILLGHLKVTGSDGAYIMQPR
jgi:hypothetical protein